jgi:acyl transferase domain-containing protein
LGVAKGRKGSVKLALLSRIEGRRLAETDVVVRSEIPKKRYNIDAYYHPDGERIGATNVRHGYFLSEDVEAFDSQFFNIRPSEVKSMDPQQRKLLEVSYEAFENAGIPLEKLSSSRTSCYIGNMGRGMLELFQKKKKKIGLLLMLRINGQTFRIPFVMTETRHPFMRPPAVTGFRY